MAWKEYRELFAEYGILKGRLIEPVIFTVLLAFYFPGLGGRAFVDSPYILLFYIFFPMMLMIVMVLDSFAGERERHTLETLLSSRLSDRAILYGKILSAVAYGWGFTVIFLAIALVVDNIMFWGGHIMMFPLPILLFVLVVAWLADLFVASVGALISLKSPSVRYGIDYLFMAVIVAAAGPFLAYSALPGDWQKTISDTLFGMGMINLALLIVTTLIALDFVILLIAARYFGRSKLIHDL